MAHTVFVCHSSKDKAVADAACGALEAHNISCWIAPRDVPPGQDYADAIVEALEESQIVLLIFSLHADKSPQVRREIDGAVSNDKTILTFCIENVRPSRAMRYFIGNRQWLDAIAPPLEARLSDLCAAVERLLHHAPVANPGRQPPEFLDDVSSVSGPLGGFRGRLENLWNLRRSKRWIAAGAIVVLGILIWSGFLWRKDHQPYQPNPQAQQWFDQGVRSLQEGNYSDATRSLDAAIDKDTQFAMAHVRLAEAWLHLDFQANAQREMLLAANGEDRLSSLDRLYYKAMQASVTLNFSAAAAIYRKIVGRLDAQDKSNGYVDLGWAEERAQEPELALKYYTKALSLNPLNAAAAVDLGVLQSRFGHVTQASQAFQQAQDIFDKASNHEGLAELDFERGYSANDRSDAKEARAYLEKAQVEAKPLNDVQLDIRILTQLSSATSRFDPKSAAQYAEDAITEANENGLTQWEAYGYVGLAAAELQDGDSPKAEKDVRQGMQIARNTGQLRVEALANYTLASIENIEHHPEEVVGPAKAALVFYQKNGFFTNGVKASVLLGRTAKDQGHFAEALASAKTAQSLASQSGNHEMMRISEELFGNTFLNKENYPEALVHFQKARTFADAESTAQYEELNEAEALWKLGRFADCEEMLRFNPSTRALASGVKAEHVGALLSQSKYAEALALAKSALSAEKSVAPADRDTFTTGETLAESYLGIKKDGLAGLAVLAANAKIDSPADAADDYRAIAEVSLNLDLAPQARNAATIAAAHFQAGGQLDSELRSFLLAAAAAKLANDASAASNFFKNALDIRSLIEQNWGPVVSQVYFSRPDLHALLQLDQRIGPSNRR